jgi:hypothetical protein
VVNADTGLYLPDFRAAERTFQLLTQVAGRAGRSRLGGRVIVQTYMPDHYAVQAASRHDYQAFFVREMAERRQRGLPPFSRLISVTYAASNEDRGRAGVALSAPAHDRHGTGQHRRALLRALLRGQAQGPLPLAGGPARSGPPISAGRRAPAPWLDRGRGPGEPAVGAILVVARDVDVDPVSLL